MKVWVSREELEVKTIFPKTAKAQAAASKRGSGLKGESGIRPGEGDPSWACCNQAGFTPQVREGTSGTPLFQSDRPEIFKC